MIMDTLNFPTKRNLLLARERLALARKGYDLLDKKRQVLVNELRTVLEQAKQASDALREALDKAYKNLHIAVKEIGMRRLSHVSAAHGVLQAQQNLLIETGAKSDGNGKLFRSIMGVELPMFDDDIFHPTFCELHKSTVSLDKAVLAWTEARKFIISWAAIENTMYRLQLHIKKTQKRANALGNITIPKYEARVKYIRERLEERERDDLARLKLVKSRG